MAIRKVVIWPNPILAAVAQPVKQIDARIKTLVRDMFDTMYDANGVGLAATGPAGHAAPGVPSLYGRVLRQQLQPLQWPAIHC